MKLLLDSHAFLWALMAPEKLSRRAEAALAMSGNEVCVSVITFWELSLKYSLGKLQLDGISPDALPASAEEAGFSLCTIEAATAASFHLLPRLAHRDPFDRMLVWQAIQSNLILVSKDPAMKAYSDSVLKILW